MLAAGRCLAKVLIQELFNHWEGGDTGKEFDRRKKLTGKLETMELLSRPCTIAK